MVARLRHFTRAAEELHVAQSALSHQIRRLEQELGTPLFERTSRRVSPTDAGRAIELDAAFRLLAGDIPDDLAFERLSDDEVVAGFAPERAPPARRVGVADLRRQAIVAPRRGSAIVSVLDELFADAGEPLRLALESGDPFLLRSLAARGFATAILPRSLTALQGPALDVRSLDPPVHLPVALVWRRQRNAPPAARRFVEFAADRAAPRARPADARRRPPRRVSASRGRSPARAGAGGLAP